VNVGGSGFGEAPVQDGRHVSSGAEVPSECVKRIHNPRSDELFGCDVEAIGVALNSGMESDRGIAEFSQLGGGGAGCLVADQDLFEQFGGGAGCDGFRWMTVCGSPSPTTCR
jgi:hypothetical protein